MIVAVVVICLASSSGSSSSSALLVLGSSGSSSGTAVVAVVVIKIIVERVFFRPVGLGKHGFRERNLFSQPATYFPKRPRLYLSGRGPCRGDPRNDKNRLGNLVPSEYVR